MVDDPAFSDMNNFNNQVTQHHKLNIYICVCVCKPLNKVVPKTIIHQIWLDNLGGPNKPMSQRIIHHLCWNNSQDS